MDQVTKELHVLFDSVDSSAYKLVIDKDITEVINEQSELMKVLQLPTMGNVNKDKVLPTFYGLPKMHKPVPKLRFIAASSKSPLKPLDLTVTACLRTIYRFMCSYCKAIYNYTGTNRMWIIDNSLQLKAKLEDCNQTMTAKSINTWDFSTLYTTIPHQLLKDNMSELITSPIKLHL